MSTHIGMHCPHCRRTVRVRVEYLGRRVRCNHCGAAFRVETEVADGPGSGTGSGEAPVLLSDEFATLGNGKACPAITGYEPLGLIREGPMGRVFKARQASVDRLVAVKILNQAFASKHEYVERFHREARLAARLAHTNIPHLIDAGEVQGCPYLVMDYAGGQSAQDRLDARGAFPEAEAVAIALDAAEALDHVHRRGLIHRDVKPANLILDGDGHARLIDFGLARPIDDDHQAVAEAGNAIGTPDYISPEQARGQADVDVRSDLYSLGATLYHLVTGRAPYLGTIRKIIHQHANPSIRPVDPERLKPSLSPALTDLIRKLTAKNRELRPARAADVIDDLRQFRQTGMIIKL